MIFCFLILTRINRKVRKIKTFLDLDLQRMIYVSCMDSSS
nr:MAG TPA: hypothetical protein [Caudoviricetes sp.]